MRFAFSILSILFFASPAIAGESYWGKKHFFNAIIDNWDYHEPSVNMTDKGLLFGGNYAFRNAYQALYYEANLEFIFGFTNCDTTAGGVPVSFEQTNTVILGQLWIGAQTMGPANLKVIPKIGLLFRKLTDADDAFNGDYERRQDYFTIPVGADFFFDVGPGKLVVGGFATVYFEGRNRSFLTDVGNSNDIDVKQDDGFGMNLEATYLWDRWQAGIFVRTWKVEDSETQDSTTSGSATPPLQLRTYWEPKNDTLSIGVRAGLSF